VSVLMVVFEELMLGDMMPVAKKLIFPVKIFLLQSHSIV